MFRTLRIVILAGIPLAFILGPLLMLKWYDGDLPFSPWKPGLRNPVGSVVYADAGKTSDTIVTWGPRSSALSAPALAMRIGNTDIYGWWWTGGGENSHRIADTKQKGGPERLGLEVTVPDSDGIALSSLQPLCLSGSAPFENCRAGRARLFLVRDDSHWDQRDILLGKKKPLEQVDLPYESRTRYSLREYWVEFDKKANRQQFLGWACGQDLHITDKEQVAPEITGMTDPRTQCYTPQTWWQRRFPEWAGLEKQRVLFTCPARGHGCNIHFLFRQRMAEMDFDAPLGAQAPLLRGLLFITAWQVLERQRVNADTPPSATLQTTLKAAKLHAAACAALVEEAEHWRDKGRWLTPEAGKAWEPHALTCRRAGFLAMSAVEQAPKELVALLPPLIKAEQISQNYRDLAILREGYLTALEKAGLGKSKEMLAALLGELETMGFSPKGQPLFERRNQLSQRAWELGNTLPDVGPEDKERLFKNMMDFYVANDDRVAEAALAAQYVAFVEARSGANSPALIAALQRLATTQWGSADFDGLRRTADRLTALYLERPPLSPMVFEATAKLETQMLGLFCVQYFRAVGFAQSAQAAVLPTVEKIIARMEQEQGPENRWVMQAKMHQKELVSRQATLTIAVGGGRAF